ncbi:MAG TPA: CpsB/CapC family capsule biosynthesis tyrosine phosphatase [Solirubrobacterales bacterium]|nr:CpsB/CapC family capsule biosynthesis tyrosine phosphatase [Solirubrobacterales bacterium]
MIDLHCHILDAIDDGARDADDSVAMARQAEADGIEAVCATPHIRHDHDVRIEELASRVHGLNERLARELVAVKVLQGGEVAETAVEGLSEEELARVSLGEGNWILLEPAPGPLDESLLRRVGHLADRGHRTIVAHPERHISHDMFERMAALVTEGALIQATADYFLREQMAAGMLAMAARGLVHVLSSDAHTVHGGRPVRISPALEKLREVDLLAAHIDWIAEAAPRAIVAGDPLKVPFEPQL